MSTILAKNESDANKTVAKVMIMTLVIFTVILILDLLNIFIIRKSVMFTAYFVSVVMLLIPTVLNNILGREHKYLKYIYVIIAALFILLITTTLSYHVVVVYAFPIVIASMYFSKPLLRFSIVITLIVTVSGQFLGYFGHFTDDLNFFTLKRLIIFGVIPRIFTLSCFAVMLESLTIRTTKLLKFQEQDMKRIRNFDNDMLTGFASLVESRDKNTGGHIMRTRAYVKLIVEELHHRKMFPSIVNDEFIDNIVKAAPLHDIGKIAIKDYVLQKEGRLTPEEFEEMKKHAPAGGDIVRETFAHVGDKKFRKIVYEVARHHHEKYNGKGYPDGLKGEAIPLCARIMTIADVFDAVSQKRCYREAMPIDQCFEIIRSGKGEDFDPALVDLFLSIREDIINEKNIQDTLDNTSVSL